MFTVYSKPNCPNCVQAKDLLTKKGLEFKEISLDFGQDKEEGKEYLDVATFKSQFPAVKMMPHILENDATIGGFSSLVKYLA